MVRQRWPLRWIVDDLVQNTYFQKRGAVLIKKMKELSTLCGILRMCVIYNPYEEPSPFKPLQTPQPPTVWPSRELPVQLMQRFMAFPGVERSKNMFNQYEYLREVIMKAEEKQRRDLKKIHGMEPGILMDKIRYGEGIEGIDMEQRRSLAWLLQAKIQDVQMRMRFPFSPHDEPSPFSPYEVDHRRPCSKDVLSKEVGRADQDVKELSTLCGIPGTCVIYRAYEEPSPSPPGQTADDPLHIDENEGSLLLMDRS
ncbi:MADS-box transcription factor PHERES 1 [Linum grandiflorum]